MATVVFLRGVNVGGHKAFRPTELVRALSALDVVSIGAAGTFVVRAPASAAVVRAQFAKHLPFEARMMLCSARDLDDLTAADPFAQSPPDGQFVSILEKRPRPLPALPHAAPAGNAWQVKLLAVHGAFVTSLMRKTGQRLVYPNEVVEKHFGVGATTRGWPTILKIHAALQGTASEGKVRTAPAKRASKMPPPLWTCPKCGAKLVTKNMWHSCGRADLAEWRKRMGPRARELYDRFEAMIADCGEYHVAPAKTRIAFMGRVRFAGISSLSEKGMSVAFALPSPLRSPRFTKIEEVAGGWWGHWLRITDPDQLDAEVQSWLRRSYELMGMQGRLSSHRR